MSFANPELREETFGDQSSLMMKVNESSLKLDKILQNMQFNKGIDLDEEAADADDCKVDN